MTTRDRQRRKPSRPSPRGRTGFTLIELLVVIVIVLLVSVVTLVGVIPALSNRQISESGRILQAALAGARDAAIRSNASRGIRLLPDTLLNAEPNTVNGVFHPGVLTFSRMIPIEPGPEYTQGRVRIFSDVARFNASENVYYSPYPNQTSTTYPPQVYPQVNLGRVLRIEECAFNPLGVPNNPTSWWWNIRVGDKIRFGDAGQYYTIVGPLTVNPAASGGANPELFVNDGLPSNVRQNGGLQTTYTGVGAQGVEFLYLVNGKDDDNDGFIDNGWDGLDNNLLNGADECLPVTNNRFGEWENETWLGSLSQPLSPATLPSGVTYSITRRPVPSPSAREIALPGGVVIDATTWNPGATQERSRLPIDPNTRTVDIMVNQSGQVVPTFPYSSPASFGIADSFYHFWLADRGDVAESEGYDPSVGPTYPSLPVPVDTPGYNGAYGFLKKDRMLVTLFTRSGLIVNNTLEVFNTNDSNLPYRAGQLGIREAK